MQLKRLVLIGIFWVLLAPFIVEVSLRIGTYLGLRASLVKKSIYSETLYEKLPSIGYRILPNKKNVLHRLEYKNGTFFESLISTDEYGRRIVPSNNNKAKNAVLIFGDSFVFGEGVNDNESIAHFLADELENTNVYPYAANGYGPQHMLWLLENVDIRAQIQQRKVEHGFYIFIPHHLSRVVGSSTTVQFAPDYEFVAGKLETSGIFYTKHNFRARLFNFLQNLELIHLLQIEFSSKSVESARALNCAILRQAAERFRNEFPGATFTVVIHRGKGAKNIIQHCGPAPGFNVFDWSYSANLPGHTISDGQHPNPLSNKKLAADLKRLILSTVPGDKAQ